MPSLGEFFSDQGSAGSWSVVPEESTVIAKSKSMWGVMPVKVRFTELNGDGQITVPQTVSGRVEIKAASLASGIGKRDEHLRSADFFETDKFPDISVLVNSAESISGDTVDLRAQLTIKGVTKPLTLKTTVTPVGDGSMRVHTEGKVNRQDFGVDGNLMGMITDDVTVSGDVVFRRAT